jgi:AraC-like DNA-binding protein
MELYIQNMVCLCCKKTIASLLNKMELTYTYLELGEVHLAKPVSAEQRAYLRKKLQEYGLNLLEDKASILVEKIVTAIIVMIHEIEEVPKVNFSDYITDYLNKDCDDYHYHYLSALFSKTKGITIERFVILHKIERVKELIMYDRLSLTEISYKLHYSSVAHLSNQFKKITGHTPTYYKKLENKKRCLLENVSNQASNTVT